jgi:hypothetical protein
MINVVKMGNEHCYVNRQKMFSNSGNNVFVVYWLQMAVSSDLKRAAYVGPTAGIFGSF